MPAGKQEAEQNAEHQFEWIKVRDAVQKSEETLKEKLSRKFGANPFVPVGCLITAAVLSIGLWNFKRGNKIMSQRMMRARVVAQGFTITALVIGLGISAARGGSK